MTDRHGIDDRYVDAAGHERTVPVTSVRRLAEIIGEPPAGDAPVVVIGQEEAARLGAGTLVLEDGGEIALSSAAPRSLPLGYHRQLRSDGSSRSVICAPARCHLPAERSWGWAAQLYALRSRQSWGIGDLADLERLAAWAARVGAGFVLTNPLGAVAPAGPQQPSPYFPASRRFRNPLYLAVHAVPGASRVADVIERATRSAAGLNESAVIDRDAIWRLKRAALEAIWAAGPPPGEFAAWRERQPAALENFALWCALCERHGPRWRTWPAGLVRRDPAALRRAADDERVRVDFHAWLQWLCERQLAAARRSVALVEDLPIGVDPDGFDAWTWQDELALEVSVGAPPDEFNRRGQNWGLPPFIPWRLRAAAYAPFIETVRAALSGGGGLRIDHVMGLFRLWWIPAGEEPAAGAYVRYPAEDLLGIVALESARANAVVVGEDLGTVEESVRTLLAERRVLSYRLLWFEQDPPERWPEGAMAAVTTHDLPTVAGLWDGSDLEAQARLGLAPNAKSTEMIRRRLARDAHLRADASAEAAIAGAYGLLARAPALLLSATLDDAVAASERPNIPGADAGRPNWSLPLAVGLEELEEHPVTQEIAARLNAAVRSPSSDGGQRPHRHDAHTKEP